MPSKKAPARTAYLAGKWLPSDQAILDAWSEKIMAKAEKDTSDLLPVVQDLKTLIETDAKAYMFFT